MLIVKYILNFSSQFSSISVLNPYYIPSLMKYHHVQSLTNRIDRTSNAFSCPTFRGVSWRPYHFRVTSCRTDSASFPPRKYKNMDNVANIFEDYSLNRTWWYFTSMKDYNRDLKQRLMKIGMKNLVYIWLLTSI